MMRSVVKETRSTASDFKQLMQVVKKGQPHQRVEVYQKHFGDKKKIAAVVEEAMKNATEEDTAMGIRRRVVAKLLDEEPPDVQAKVDAKAEELKGQRQAKLAVLTLTRMDLFLWSRMCSLLSVGNDFQDTYLVFEENIQDPFGKHVSNCFRMYPYTSLV
ncbi:hypothetical protein B0H34DRAFT_707316 [Crassisporium funariophilum]|nr:hypothetical protein B0H34DRAFT_707316 [Crassisporium funariophilum]